MRFSGLSSHERQKNEAPTQKDTTMNNSNQEAREYRVQVKHELIRSFEDPHNPDIRIIHAYVRVADFPHKKLPDEINPRRHEKLVGSIPAKITNSIETTPEWFHLLNRGLLVIAQKAWYDNKTNTLHIVIQSDSDGGLADGATTDRVLADVKKNISEADFETLTEKEIPEYIKRAYVHLEIISGTNGDILVPLTGARNTSLQVKEFALEDLRGGYKKLKEVLNASPYKDIIRYRENDAQSVDIRTILGILILFHPKWDEVRRHPIVSYTSKGSVLNYFQDEEWESGFDQLTSVAVDILNLHNYIHLNFQEQYKKAFGKDGRVGNRKEVRYLDGKDFLWHPLLNQKVKYGIPDGWVYPILAVFRTLIKWPKSGKGHAEWIENPEKCFDRYGSELIESLIEQSENLGRNANATGKSKAVWNMLYLTFKYRISQIE
jgi:hypothetical protein